MEQEDNHAVCEARDSEDTEMGSDSENSEDREGDLEERGMGSNARDADKTGGHQEQGMGSNPQDEAPQGDSEERELVSGIRTGEEKGGVSTEAALLTCIPSSFGIKTRASILGRVIS